MNYINREIERGFLAHALMNNSIDDLHGLSEHDFGDADARHFYKCLVRLESEYKPIEQSYIETKLDELEIPEHSMLEVISTAPLFPSSDYKEMIKELSFKRIISESIRKHATKLHAKSSLETAASLAKEMQNLQEQMFYDESTFEMMSITNVDEPPVEFVGINYIPLPKNSTVLLAGRGGVGKSSIALQSAIKYIISTGNKAFCWLSEDPLGETKQRAMKICDQLAYDFADLEDKLFITNRRTFNIALRENGNVMANPELVKLQEATKDFGMIVLDPLRSFASNFDENSNSEMDNVTKEFTQWAKKEEKIIVLIHHASKDGDVRGASSIVDASRLAYMVREGDRPSIKRVELAKDNFGVAKLINGNALMINSIRS